MIRLRKADGALSEKGCDTGAGAAAAAAGSSSTTTVPTYGLGLTGGISGASMDISTKTGADLARSQLLGVLSQIQNTYKTSNTPPAAATTGNNSGTASSSTTAQLASYNMALSLLGSANSDPYANIAQIVAGMGSTGSHG